MLINWKKSLSPSFLHRSPAIFVFFKNPRCPQWRHSCRFFKVVQSVWIFLTTVLLVCILSLCCSHIYWKSNITMAAISHFFYLKNVCDQNKINRSMVILPSSSSMFSFVLSKFLLVDPNLPKNLHEAFPCRAPCSLWELSFSSSFRSYIQDGRHDSHFENVSGLLRNQKW